MDYCLIDGISLQLIRFLFPENVAPGVPSGNVRRCISLARVETAPGNLAGRDSRAVRFTA